MWLLVLCGMFFISIGVEFLFLLCEIFLLWGDIVEYIFGVFECVGGKFRGVWFCCLVLVGEWLIVVGMFCWSCFGFLIDLMECWCYYLWRVEVWVGWNIVLRFVGLGKSDGIGDG